MYVYKYIYLCIHIYGYVFVCICICISMLNSNNYIISVCSCTYIYNYYYIFSYQQLTTWISTSGAMTFSVITFRLMTLGNIYLIATFSTNYTQDNNTWHKHWLSLYWVLHFLIIMLSVVMPSIRKLFNIFSFSHKNFTSATGWGVT